MFLVVSLDLFPRTDVTEPAGNQGEERAQVSPETESPPCLPLAVLPGDFGDEEIVINIQGNGAAHFLVDVRGRH